MPIDEESKKHILHSFKHISRLENMIREEFDDLCADLGIVKDLKEEGKKE